MKKLLTILTISLLSSSAIFASFPVKTSTAKEKSTVVAKEKTNEEPIVVAEKHTTKEAKKADAKTARQEKKALKKEVKSKLKQLKSSSENASSLDPLILALLSIIFPLAPIMMYLFEGSLTTRFWISLILSFLFYLPAIIYNFIVMLA